MHTFNVWDMFNLHWKKIVLILLVLLSFGVHRSSAQNYPAKNMPNYDKKLLHFGITMAINRSSFKFEKSEQFLFEDSIMSVEPKGGPGFNLGIISNLCFGEHGDLRFIPSLSFAERSLRYGLMDGTFKSKKVESTYLDFPFHLKLKSDRINDFRFYMIAGYKFSIDMISNAEARNANDKIKIKGTDNFIEYGIGTDIYFEMFKFSLEMKFSNSLSNILVEDPAFKYASVLEKLLAKTVLFSMHFE